MSADKSFEWWGQRLAYHDHSYNTTRRNERAVELPVAEAWLRPELRTLEVGNVLSHYGIGPKRRVVDRYESGEGVENLDIFSIEGDYEQIVSLSTLEHVRWDEQPRENDGAIRALEHLLTLLDPGGRMLLSVPTGWNDPLDEALTTRDFGCTRACTIVRDGNGWRQTDEVEITPYGFPPGWAGAVWIGEWS